MDRPSFREEAENCRQQAVSYVGKPESPFLLRLAEAFDQLHVERGWFDPECQCGREPGNALRGGAWDGDAALARR